MISKYPGQNFIKNDEKWSKITYIFDPEADSRSLLRARMRAPSDYVAFLLARGTALSAGRRRPARPCACRARRTAVAPAAGRCTTSGGGGTHGPQIGNYLGDAPMHYLWAPIRPFIGGGHTVWPVLPRFSICKNTNLRPGFRGFPENPGFAFEGSCS